MNSAQLYCLHCGAANDTDADYCFACDHDLKQSEPLTEDDNPLLHDRYQLLHKAGIGGFGAVYKAKDAQSYHQVVAVKQIMLRGLSAQEVIEATDGFNREVRILSHLSHAHLPRIRDHFTDQENWYLVMDFIEGETLETYLRRPDTQEKTRTLPLPEVLDIAMQLCSVLDYLHTRQPPIIFRDLKPSNIMRTPAGKLYMIDFGIARQFKPGQTRDTMVFGSPGYAAPEQYGKAQTTPAADIYSLGALLHQLLSGIDPAENPFHFTPLHLYGTDGVDRLATLIQLMVNMHAEKRPASIKAVQAELQTILDQQQPAAHLIQSTPRTPYYQPSTGTASGSGLGSQQQQQQIHKPSTASRTGRRSVMKGLLVLGIVGATSSGAGSYLIEHLFDRPQPHFMPPIGRGGPHLPAPGNTPDQLAAVNALEANNHLQGREAVNAVRYAPDGRFFASGNDHGVVHVVDTRAASILASTPAYSTAIMSLSWSFDGGYLAFSTKNEVYIVQVTPTADTVQLSHPMLVYSLPPSPQENIQTSIYTLAWSPKEDLLAVSDYTGVTHLFQMIGNRVNQLKILDAGYSSFRPIAPNAYTPLSNQLAWSPDGKQIVTVNKPNGYSVWQVEDQKVVVDTSFARNVPIQLGWQADSTTPIILVMNESIHLTDLSGNARYDALLPDHMIDIAYVQAFDIFIALANGDIYRWLPDSGDPFLVKNGNDTLAALNSIAITRAGNSYSLVAAFSDGMMISYAVPPLVNKGHNRKWHPPHP